MDLGLSETNYFTKPERFQDDRGSFPITVLSSK